MSDWGQGFPWDPPGMVPTPHLTREEDRAVGDRHRTKGRSLDFGAVRNLAPLSPHPGKAQCPDRLAPF